ncbi:hypothetical protein HanIR_Chr09g0442821 [Helianthus annuus]|nr:hypothetical protein HanIR_Chr09g0442821 [Helianthus annuus]
MSIFFVLTRCNGRAWFNDFTYVFRSILFSFTFLFILLLRALLMLVVASTAVALVLLGTIFYERI